MWCVAKIICRWRGGIVAVGERVAELMKGEEPVMMPNDNGKKVMPLVKFDCTAGGAKYWCSGL